MAKGSIIPEDTAPFAPAYAAPDPLSKSLKSVVLITILLSVIFSVCIAIKTPLLTSSQGSFINAPDEAAHMEYVKILAIDHALPKQ